MSADLEIGIQPRGGDQYVIELRDENQPEADRRRQSKPLRFPFDELRALEGVPEVYGRVLWNALFADQAIRSEYAGVVDGVLNGPAPAEGPWLRVRLDISPDATKVHGLRWECLYDPDRAGGIWVASDERVLFTRFAVSAARRFIRPAPKSPAELKVVLAVAGPSIESQVRPSDRILHPVKVAEEVDRARTALAAVRAGCLTILADSTQLAPAQCEHCGGRATLENLARALREGCDVLYLVCHGALTVEAQLWLETDMGAANAVSGSKFLEKLNGLTDLPRLVVVASCDSAGPGREPQTADGGAFAALGQKLAEWGVPAVLAISSMSGSPTRRQPGTPRAKLASGLFWRSGDRKYRRRQATPCCPISPHSAKPSLRPGPAPFPPSWVCSPPHS